MHKVFHKSILVVLCFSLFLFLFPLFGTVSADPPGANTTKAPAQIGCSSDFGPFGSLLCGSNANNEGFLGGILNHFVSSILGLLTAIAGLYFLFQFVTAAIAWIGAGGDKASVEAARSKIFNAIIGLVVVASAWVLVGIIGKFVGLDILNAGSMIDKLRLNPTP